MKKNDYESSSDVFPYVKDDTTISPEKSWDYEVKSIFWQNRNNIYTESGNNLTAFERGGFVFTIPQGI